MGVWSKMSAEQRRKHSQLVQRRRQARVHQLKEMAGGKCVLCGYVRCYRALEFHHVNPETKSFEIADYSRSFDLQVAEIKKCILLCANCHREVEDGLRAVS